MPYCDNCDGYLVLTDDGTRYVCISCGQQYDRDALHPVPHRCEYCTERLLSWCNFLWDYTEAGEDRSHECIELSRYVPQQYLPEQMEAMLSQMKDYPKSFYDADGRLFVSCWECTRGFKSRVHDKCHYSDGTKAQPHLGCFYGTLMPEIDRATLRSLPRVIKHHPGHPNFCDDGTPCRGQDRCVGFEQCQGGGNNGR